MVTNLIRKILPINRTSDQNLDRKGRDGSLMILGRTDSCNESGFNQWRDAMRMVARLPGGLPTEFRLRLWENLADRYLLQSGIEWTRIGNKCRVETSRDEEIAEQIHKDLHRTGCRGFSGAKQAVLKQVLVSYARWNPAVGYCQGFNMIGAMLLQMTNGDEKLTLKILIYLIEGVLPEGYFSPGLRGLAVDMAVFREILKLRKPSLNAHLSRLQKRDDSPPLTDVFTMHWFLTLFIHCLPTNSVLRIWDLILLEGSEVLLRTALVLWATIETRILCVSSTDEFYSVMGVVTRELLEFGLMDPNSLVKCIVSIGPFPFPGLEDFRQKHRALISQDTPHKSFFLAKKELDSLKRHYATIRHRQRATTVILKGLNTQMKDQRSTLAVPTKRQVVSPKPKIRRQTSGGKTCSTNSVRNNGSIPSTPRAKQVTVAWDKVTKKPKTFRKRRASASSHTTSSSSSTELCDSSSDNENGSDNAWIGPLINQNPSSEGETVENQETAVLEIPSQRPIIMVPKSSTSSEDCPDEKLLLTLNDSECSSDGSKCIDTNDSQHFLDEMSRLGKSDSFYGNLSQRICELQFQNLRILTTCNTVIDKQVSPRDDFEISPMPSPSTPVKPIRSNLEISKLATLSPNQWSPRGSLSSNGGESPLPRSPLSPMPKSPLSPMPKSLLSPVPKSPISPASDTNLIGLKGSQASTRSNSSGDVLANELENNEAIAWTEFTSNSLTVPEVVPVESPTRTFLDTNAFDSSENCADLDNETFNYSDDYGSTSQLMPSPIKTKERLNLHLDLNLPAKEESVLLSTSVELPGGDYSISDVSLDAETEVVDFPNVSPKSTDVQCKENPGTSDGQTVQTTEDINAVIRENIAILQRLKLKPAYGEEEDDFDYFEYDSSDSNEVSDAEPCCTSRSSSNHVNVKTSYKTSPSRLRKSSSTSSSTNSESRGRTQTCKPKTYFNPFPTKRKSQLRTTKFGLYS